MTKSLTEENGRAPRRLELKGQMATRSLGLRRLVRTLPPRRPRSQRRRQRAERKPILPVAVARQRRSPIY